MEELKMNLSTFITLRQEVANRDVISVSPEYKKLSNEYNRMIDTIKEKIGSDFTSKFDSLTGQIEAAKADVFYLQGLKDGIKISNWLGGLANGTNN